MVGSIFGANQQNKTRLVNLFLVSWSNNYCEAKKSGLPAEQGCLIWGQQITDTIEHNDTYKIDKHGFISINKALKYIQDVLAADQDVEECRLNWWTSKAHSGRASPTIIFWTLLTSHKKRPPPTLPQGPTSQPQTANNYNQTNNLDPHFAGLFSRYKLDCASACRNAMNLDWIDELWHTQACANLLVFQLICANTIKQEPTMKTKSIQHLANNSALKFCKQKIPISHKAVSMCCKAFYSNSYLANELKDRDCYSIKSERL